MSRHKIPRLNTRNWEKLIELDEAAISSIDKLPFHSNKESEAATEEKKTSRKFFYRSRLD